MRGPDRPRRLVAAGVVAAGLITVCWSVAAAGAQTGTSSQRRATTTVPRRVSGGTRSVSSTTVAEPFITAAPTTLPPTTTVAPIPSIADQGNRVTTKGKVDDPAQKRLRWIIVGLVGLAVIVAGLTIWLWRATRPDSLRGRRRRRARLERRRGPGLVRPASTRPGSCGRHWRGRGGSVGGRRVPRRPPPVPPGHREPIWADEHAAAAPMTITTTPTAAPVSTPDAGDGEVSDD